MDRYGALIDPALLDIPGISRRELRDCLRRRFPGMSGDTGGLAIAAAKFVAKPFTAQNLLRRVTALTQTKDANG